MKGILMEHVNEYEIKESLLQRNGTYVTYPTIVSEDKSEKADIWNRIILQDIDKILSVFSAYTLSSAPEEAGLYQPITLGITYEIKRNDSRCLSIFYTANFFNPYAAYPIQMIFTTNIDKEHDSRVILSDFITDVRSLAHDINNWDIITVAQENKEYTLAIRDYINGLGKEILHMGFEAADIIGPDNYLGIYTYLTPDKLGISMALPNYLGDHAEFEKEIK
jgi:hypothetical protein